MDPTESLPLKSYVGYSLLSINAYVTQKQKLQGYLF